MDWIDHMYRNRLNGTNTPLTPMQHRAVNLRYQGCTLEYCCECGSPTGKAGKGEGSLFTETGDGPFCQECF